MAKEKTSVIEDKAEAKVEEKIKDEGKVESKKESEVVVRIEEKAVEREIVDSAEDKKPRDERTGIAYVYATFNNTIVHITDLAGNTISRVSGGMVTKHDRLKSNPTIAMFVAKKAAEKAKDVGITSLYVRMRAQTGGLGMGPGAHAAITSLGKEGFRIVNVLDTTKVARGGPKKKGGKRGRTV